MSLQIRVSGCTDYLFQSEIDGILKTREMISHLPRFDIDSPNMDNPVDPLYSADDLNGLILNLDTNDENPIFITMQVIFHK